MRILVLGYMVRSGMGRIAWHYLHYIVGLERLGHDVYFLEDSGDSDWCCHHPSTGALDTDPGDGLAFTDDVFDRLGLNDRWAYHDAHTARWLGPAAGRVPEIVRTADAFINVSGSNAVRSWWDGVPVRIMVDTDPALHQVRNLQDEERRSLSEGPHFYSFGENIGTPASRIPDDGIAYRPTRQPFVPDLWPVAAGPPGRASHRFSTGRATGDASTTACATG